MFSQLLTGSFHGTIAPGLFLVLAGQPLPPSPPSWITYPVGPPKVERPKLHQRVSHCAFVCCCLFFIGESESCSVMSDSLRPHGLYSPWNSPAQNTGVGNLSLLQGIFPTQGSSTGLPHCRWTLYQLSHKGSPRILEYTEAYPFSSGPSRTRSWTGVSCIAGEFFTNWSIREAIFWIGV